MNHEHACEDWRLMRVGSIEVWYYAREPSPDRWNAIALIQPLDASPESLRRCPLIVGVGSTYFEAVGDLVARVLGGTHSDLPLHLIERESPLNDPDGLAQSVSATGRLLTERRERRALAG